MNRKQKDELINVLLCEAEDELIETRSADVKELARSKETYYRSMTARAMANYRSSFAKNLLIELADDKHPLVRTEAVDSLRYHPSHDVIEFLMRKSINDKYYLVRAYAIYSSCIICDAMKISKDEVFLLAKSMLIREHYVINKVFCLEVMYMCGDKDALLKIIDYFQKGSYKNQCIVLNVLMELLNDDNKDLIEKFVMKIEVSELPKSVVVTLRELMKKLSTQ